MISGKAAFQVYGETLEGRDGLAELGGIDARLREHLVERTGIGRVAAQAAHGALRAEPHFDGIGDGVQGLVFQRCGAPIPEQR